MRCLLILALLAVAACQPAMPPAMPLPVRILNVWEAADGALPAEGGAEQWQFVAQAGDQIRLRLRANDAALALTAPSGAALGAGQQVEAALPESGVYTVTVTGAGRYQLGLGYTDRPHPAAITPTPLPALVGVPTPTAPYYAALGDVVGALSAGGWRDGELADGAARHVYTFEGQAGVYVTLRLGRLSGAFDPVLTLYGPDGAALAADDNTGGGRTALLRDIRLPQTGTYSAQVWGDGFAGRYEISLEMAAQAAPLLLTLPPAPSPTPLPPLVAPTLAAAYDGARLEDHTPVIGRIERPGAFVRYTLAAQAGDVLTIGVSPAAAGGIQPRLELYDPAGNLLVSVTAAQSNAGGDALAAALPVSATGIYLAFVTAPGGETGDFIISYGRGNSREDALRGMAPPDQPLTGSLARRGLRDVWGLALNAGDVIAAAVQPGDTSLLPTLELVGPSGALVAQGVFGAGREVVIESALAPVSGLYRLHVAALGAASSGPYTLVWRIINLAPTATPEPAAAPLLTFDDQVEPGAYRFFPFQGRAGQLIRVRVRASPGSGLDPVAALIGPDGAVIAEGDDWGDDLNPQFTVRLPRDGTYQVRVSGYLSGGKFEVWVEALLPLSSG